METNRQNLMVSIVCPIFNEVAVIGRAVAELKGCIDRLDYDCEILLINDGSTDETVTMAIQAIGGDRRFRLLNHRANFGRGRALRTGFLEARGDIIVTTEGDLSWGADVIGRMVEALNRNPRLDAVFASPHLPGGGYQNVPWQRVLLSKLGNRVLRFFYAGGLSMTTGMTRAYRANIIQAHTFTEDGKELHLEISHRLLVLGCRIGEVAAVLNWPEPGRHFAGRGRRTSWGKVFKLISSHMAFGVVRGFSQLIGPTIVLLSLAILFFGSWAVWNLLTGAPSIYLATLTSILVILWVTLIMGYFLLRHTLQVEKDVWQTQSMLGSFFRAQDQSSRSRHYYTEIDVAAAIPKPASRAGSL